MEFPSPVGGLSLIHVSTHYDLSRGRKVSVPCRGIISYSKELRVFKNNKEVLFPSPVGGLSLIQTIFEGIFDAVIGSFRPLSGDYLLFIPISSYSVPLSVRFRPLSGDYLLFENIYSFLYC